MAKKERSTLKSYFRTGNIPNQSQYEDLIDSAAEKISSFVEKAKQENLSQ